MILVKMYGLQFPHCMKADMTLDVLPLIITFMLPVALVDNSSG